MATLGAQQVIVLTAAEAAAVRARGFEARSAASFLDAATLRHLEDEAAERFDRLGECEALRRLLTYDGLSLWTAAESRVQRWRGLFDALVARQAAPSIAAAGGPLHLWGAEDDLLLRALSEAAEHPSVWERTPPWRESLLRRKARAFVQEYRRAHSTPRLLLPRAGERRWLFFLYTDRHAALMRTLWPLLATHSMWQPLVIALGSRTEAVLDGAAIPYSRFWGYFPPAEAVRRRLRVRWANALKEVNECFREDAARSLWPLLEGKMRRLFSTSAGEGRLFDELFFDAALYVEAVRAMLVALRPHLVVVMDELHVLGRVAVLTARREGLPTLHLQQSMMTDRLLWRKVHSDRRAVWGEEDRRRLIEAGVAPTRVVVTGNPAFDRLAGSVERDLIERVRASLRLDNERPLALVMTPQEDFAAGRRLIEAVAEAGRHFPHLQIVIKLRSADDEVRYRRFVEREGLTSLRLVRQTDEAALLALSDLLIAPFSTTALEAILQGKPVIVVNFGRRAAPLPYVERGVALGVRDPSALSAAIRAVLEDEPTRRRLREGMARFVRDYAYRLDGRAGERVLALMEEMMSAQLRDGGRVVR